MVKLLQNSKTLLCIVVAHMGWEALLLSHTLALHLVLQVLVEQRELVAYSRKVVHSRQPSDDPDDRACEPHGVTSKMMLAVAWLPAGGSRLLA